MMDIVHRGVPRRQYNYFHKRCKPVKAIVYYESDQFRPVWEGNKNLLMRRPSSILIKKFHTRNKFSHCRSVDVSQPILPFKARGSKFIQTQEIM